MQLLLNQPGIDVNAQNYEGPVYLPNSYMNEYRNAVDFTVNVGYQKLFNPLVVEFYSGIGFRRFWEVRSDIETGTVNSTTGSSNYANLVRNYNGYRPEFNLALNFGGFF